MIVSRAAVAVGFGVVGVGLLVGPTLGQQDGGVQKANTRAAAAPKPAAPAVIGTVDLGNVFKNYDKFKVAQEEFKSAAMAKSNELMKLMNEAQTEADQLAKMTPGSHDYKKHEDKISDLKAKHEAGREQAQRDFTLREAEMMSTIYKEVSEMVAAVAAQRGMTYVVKVSNEPVNASNPNSVVAAIERAVVYADPKNDITEVVVYWLNQRYKAAGGTAPKASTPSSSASAPTRGTR